MATTQKKYIYKNTSKLKDVRKYLRHNPVLAEKILWQFLKGKQLGFKFRRQFSIINRIADFCCEGLKLVIELDGWTHDSDITQAKDEVKQKMFESCGYRVIRFTNEQVYGDIGKLVDEIKRICDERANERQIPHPLPLP